MASASLRPLAPSSPFPFIPRLLLFPLSYSVSGLTSSPLLGPPLYCIVQTLVCVLSLASGLTTIVTGFGLTTIIFRSFIPHYSLMFSSKFFTAAAVAAFSLTASSVAEVTEGSITPATYVPGGNSNLVMYWVSAW